MSESGPQRRPIAPAIVVGPIFIICLAWSSTLAATDYGDFFDDFFSSEMDRFHVPGAVVVVVADGVVALSRGYGVADLEALTPVDPDETRFVIGSVTKLFTATLVMQARDENLLSLDDPIVNYIDAKIAGGITTSPTIHQLLTHTGGYEDRVAGVLTPPGDVPPSLEVHLARSSPRQVYPVGQIISYSNYGYGLLGHIAASVKASSYQSLLYSRLLKPLRMWNTGFDLIDDADKRFARGYVFKSGTHHPVRRAALNLVSSGGLYSTGTDMALFASLHLEGNPSTSDVLGATSLREMHARQFTHHPELRGWCYGFFEDYLNGQLAIQHGGSFLGTSSRLFLLPDHGIALFFAYNLQDDYQFSYALLKRFMNQYYPSRVEPSLSMGGPESNWVGVFRHTKYAHSTWEKLRALDSSVPELSVRIENHKMRIGDRYYDRISPALYRHQDGHRVFFRSGEGRGPDYLFVGSTAYHRIARWESRSAQLLIIGGSLAGILGAAVCSVRWRRNSDSRAREPRTLTEILTVVVGGVVAVQVLATATLIDREVIAFYRLPPMYLVSIIAWVIAAVTIVQALATARMWWLSQGTLGRRLVASLSALAASLFTSSLVYWRVLIVP